MFGHFTTLCMEVLKNVKKQPWRHATFGKVAGFSCVCDLQHLLLTVARL